jgi:HEAT repeat protein
MATRGAQRAETVADGQAGDPPDPMEDPTNRDKVEAAKVIVVQLLKGIKQIAMYRHAEGKFGEFMEKTHEAFSQYLETYGPLSLKVESQNFQMFQQDLFEEPTPMAFKFYRDGIRNLIFRPGLSVDELVTFTLIAISEPERGADDVIAQLWKASLEHLEYVVVEGFRMDEFSEQEVQVEVDQIVSFLYSRLRTQSSDFLRFARVSTEDLEVKLEGIDQIRGAVVQGAPAGDDLKAKVQKEIQEEESARLFPKLVSAVFQVVEGGVEDPMLLEDMFVQLLDALLLQEDYATINQMILKLKAMEQRQMANEGLSRLRATLVSRMGEEQRLTRIGDMLKVTRPKNPQDLIRYFQALEADSIPTLLTVLESMEIPENRTMLCDLMVPFCKEMPDPFITRLQADRPQTVRDMVYILEKAKLPDRIKLFAGALKNKNLAVKLEVMSIIAQGRTAEARKAISEMTEDSNVQVRMVAIKLLPEFDRERAYIDLMKVATDGDFEKKDPRERAAIYSALGSTGVPNALAHLSEILGTKAGLLNRKKVLDDKLLAIHGLAGACSVQSYKVLQKVVEERNQPAEVLTAARKAMYQVKKALFGEGEAPQV